jgi:hypothetical protein
MVGSWSVLVHDARTVQIHGDVYYDLTVARLDDPAAKPTTLRVPRHALGADPQPGDHLSLTFLMGQVTSAKPLP